MPADFDLCLVIQHAPLRGQQSKEALDIALVSATFDQATALFFQGEGLLHLRPHQTPKLIGMKGVQAMLPALALYGIEAIYCLEEDLARYQLQADQLLLTPKVLDTAQAQELLSRSRQVFISPAFH
ncbi:DsrE family protein [Marinospirillum sp.]|uniref:DsrE family protein n=1 Tax=Marinospirillum sp. TaxID=2183934 RepID=UPI003A859907